MDRTPAATTGASPALARFDPFSTGSGLTLMGVGLLCLAVVEAAGLFVRATPLTSAPGPDAPLGVPSPAMVAFEPLDPQNAVGTGPAAPKPRERGTAPAPSGSVIGIAATPIPNGTALYRLWSSGAIEAMITTEANVWSEWSSAAPGETTQKRRPKAPTDNPDTTP